MSTIQLNGKNILLLSDTHGKHRALNIPEKIDMVIHCGDICSDGNVNQIEDFFKWYSDLKIAYKIFVHGNHDLPFELEPERSRALLPKNVRWLNDESTVIEGIKVRGVSPFFFYQPIDAEEEIDLLISHVPPLGILDDGIGMEELRDYVLAVKPKFHVFGHNHAGSGKVSVHGIQFINASLFNELLQS